jgi:hypothetical protein
MMEFFLCFLIEGERECIRHRVVFFVNLNQINHKDFSVPGGKT